MIHEYRLESQDIRHQTMKTLMGNITLEANGYQSTTEMVYDIVLKASAERSSIEASCKDLEETVGSNTVRDYLNDALPMAALREQEAEMNAALADSIPQTMRRTGLEVAIDFHDEPFYGKQEDLLNVSCRGRAKDGTTHFIRIATAYVIWRQVRLTLAVHYILPEEEKLDILKQLFEKLNALDFTFRVLYLDKGFATTPIIAYLSDNKQPTIIACPIRGKSGGTRALCRGRKSYLTDHTFTNGTQARMALVASLVPDKSGKRRRKWLAFIMICLDWSPEKIYHQYRRRFGVECSYRLMRRVRATTTSRNPTLRFFLLGIGLVLVNIWVFLRWEFARTIGPGPRRVDPLRFRFHCFIRLLIRSIEMLYGAIISIPTHISPQSVIY